ncbi:hypothetical protein Tco_1208023 [Tanacetum coccineum]
MSTSKNSNQQTLADLGANERHLMLERGNYIPWESRFRRFLDNKLEEGERMWKSIQNGPYVRPIIPDPDGVVNINGTMKQILEPLSKMTEGNKKQYIADVKVMNYLFQAIPNDIYNSVDACKNTKEMWERIKRLMFSSDVTSHCQSKPSFSIVCNPNGANMSPWFVIIKLGRQFLMICFVDYEDEYQGEIQWDSQEDKLTTSMMLLARAITQKFSIPTNNSLRTSSNTRNQAVIQDGRVDIQTKNTGYGGNGNKNAGRQSRNQAFNAGNGNDYNSHYAHYCQKPRVRDAKYFREQMLLAMKDEAGSNLNSEENDFMLDTSYGEETIEELTATVMLMARIQPADGNAETVPSYDAKVVSEDDQIDSNIIFDDPYVENNGGTSDHDSNDHDEYHKIQMLAYDVQR